MNTYEHFSDIGDLLRNSIDNREAYLILRSKFKTYRSNCNYGYFVDLNDIKFNAYSDWSHVGLKSIYKALNPQLTNPDAGFNNWWYSHILKRNYDRLFSHEINVVSEKKNYDDYYVSIRFFGMFSSELSNKSALWFCFMKWKEPVNISEGYVYLIQRPEHQGTMKFKIGRIGCLFDVDAKVRDRTLYDRWKEYFKGLPDEMRLRGVIVLGLHATPNFNDSETHLITAFKEHGGVPIDPKCETFDFTETRLDWEEIRDLWRSTLDNETHKGTKCLVKSNELFDYGERIEYLKKYAPR